MLLVNDIMKGAILQVRILTGIALGLGILMAILNLYPSWSQTAGTVHDPLLYATLFCISSVFMIASYNSANINRTITKIWLINTLTLGQLYRIVSYMFGGVIAFSVNNNFWLIEYLHLIFTGLAILWGYIGLLTYPETTKGKLWALNGFIVGVGGFLMGFVFNIYSTAWAEVIAAIPLAIWVNITFNSK